MKDNFENEFCTYKQSLSLEKIGLDISCLAYYSHNNFFRVSSSKSICYSNKLDFLDIWEPDPNSIVSAPLLQQAFKFFTQNNYYNDVKKISEDKWQFVIEKGSTITLSDYYQTHPECVEACLDKLIEMGSEEKRKNEILENGETIQEIKDFLRENSLFTFEAHDDLIAEFLKTVN